MAEIKTLLTITQETLERDQPFVDTITAEIISAINSTMEAEIEYKVIYDINSALTETSGPIQITRIKNYFLETLKSKGYRAYLADTEIEPFVFSERLIITWTIAGLRTSL